MLFIKYSVQTYCPSYFFMQFNHFYEQRNETTASIYAVTYGWDLIKARFPPDFVHERKMFYKLMSN
jgi:hypothetical protein